MEPQTSLTVAVRNGRPDLAQQALAAGANINASNSFGETPLILAVKSRKPQMVDWLIEKGADLNKKNKTGDSALHIAAQISDLLSLRIFIDHGVDINIVNYQKETPLFLAACAHNIACVNELLLRGANTNIANIANMKPIDITHNDNIRLSLMTATIEQSDSPDDLDNIFFAKIEPKNIHQSLMLAAIQGKKSAVVQCLEQGADPEHTTLWGKTVLIEAIKANEPDIVEILLSWEAHPNRPDASGLRPIHASVGRHPDCLEHILRYGAKIDATAYNRMTALHFAAAKNNIGAVNLLLAFGANPAHKNIHGQTADQLTKEQTLRDLLSTRIFYGDFRTSLWQWRDKNGFPPDSFPKKPGPN